MKFKDLIKTTEGLVVIGGLLATIIVGKLFAYITLPAYIVLNVPNIWTWIKSKYNSIKEK